MTKRMLIDATHAEETRVVVLDGNRLEDFDVETSTKRQLKGNIYLAKVVRVEPSLQAAFVEYGGNRHGFLAFSEIHPDYYQIPVADRQRLIEMQAEEARREEEEADLELALTHGPDHQDPDDPLDDAPYANGHDNAVASPPPPPDPAIEAWARPSLPLLLAADRVTATDPVDAAAESADQPPTLQPDTTARADTTTADAAPPATASAAEPWAHPELPLLVTPDTTSPAMIAPDEPGLDPSPEVTAAAEDSEDDHDLYSTDDNIAELPPPETMGGDQDNGDDQRERRLTSRFMRNYKIQEVIRRRQILLIQVVKEERGTKGAALTTYLSLAGRFGVLMPNSPRGGGISRKITSAADRRRLKEVMAELDIPRGMGMIVRTAGANRPKPEIKRDCEYLLRLWDDIREHTMKSVAPALIYEEASLIKRAIRDVYSRDIDEILVDGEDGWRAAHDFMRMLMPSHAKKVQLWSDGGQPLFARNQVEAQLDGMLMPTVQLRSGGYLVINQAEALVAIDVNSGRSTRERNIEETALRTNLEAADEVARQLRLRDLAGLIVIDFIDMESKRHNAMVERRMKEALKNDRARIQVGHISHFGLLEMSRQRLRPSLAETSFIPCPHCGGTGHVRSTENAAIHVLRGIEDEGSKRRAAEIVVHVSTPVALYLLNHKRERLREIELRYVMRVIIAADDAQIAPQFRIDRIRMRSADELAAPLMPERPMMGQTGMAPQIMAPPLQESDPEDEEDVVTAEDEDEEAEDETAETHTAEAGEAPAGETAEEAEKRRRKRRRRRRGGRRDEPGAPAETTDDAKPTHVELHPASLEPAATTEELVATAAPDEPGEPGEAAPSSDEDQRNRRRGRRGGRRRRRDNDGDASPFAVPGAEQPDLVPVYAGPTPADPFGGRAFDIFDVMDQVERQAEAVPLLRAVSAVEILNVTGPEPEALTVEVEQTTVITESLSVVVSALHPATEILNATAPEPEASVPDGAASASAPVAAAEPGQPADADLPTADQAAGHPLDPEMPTGLNGLDKATTAAEPDNMDQRESQPAAGSLNGAAAPSHAPADPEPAIPTPANDVAAEMVIPEPPPAEPAIKPILVGAGGEPPAERKRGWWRR